MKKNLCDAPHFIDRMMDQGDHLVEWFPFSSYTAIMDLFRKQEFGGELVWKNQSRNMQNDIEQR